MIATGRTNAKASNADGTKAWKCRRGHELGMICWNGDGIPQLELFRHAIDRCAERPAGVDVLGVLEGRMPVVCDVDGCGDVQVWEVSAEVLNSLLARMNGKKLTALIERVRASG